TREALERMLSRVSAIATVHRRLFQSQDIARFDVGAFVRDLLGDVTAGSEGQVEMDLQRIDIAAAQAAPLALVVNELVDNAHRHGAPADGEAHIELTVRRLNGHYVICVRDHGPGLPESGEFTPGFGLTITELLAQQLRATLSFEAAEPGVRAVLKLPVEA
ncbi:MAG TPA: sensor histidine kinase, partial [Phenylobacterium sp.]|nr:sensor histidine kinase [Phenylobacterium sp.]